MIPSPAEQARAFMRALGALPFDGTGMTVGIQGQGADAAQPDRPTIAQYALINEFGRGVPERPFMRTTFARHYREWVAAARRGLRLRLAGDEREPMATLRVAAGVAAGQMRAVLYAGPWVPNSAETRRRKTRGGTRRNVESAGKPAEELVVQPLIDTGAMVQNIRGAVETRAGTEIAG